MASNVYFPRNLGFHLYGQVLSNSPLCDTIIEVNENKQIFCHAAIISCASDILKELLDLATLNQNGKKVLNFTSACSETMFCVLDYIYTGRETYNAANVTRVLATALLVGCRTMQAMCLNYIEITRKQLIGMHTANNVATKAISAPPKITIPDTNSADSNSHSSSGTEDSPDSCPTSPTTTHQPLHRVLRIAKTPPTSACASPRSDVDETDSHSHHSDSEQPSIPVSTALMPQVQMPVQMPSLMPQHGHLMAHTPAQMKMASQFMRHNRLNPILNSRNGNTAGSPQEPSDMKKYCKDCNRSFATVGSYTRHLRMIHYKLRPLTCDTCGHAFYQRSDLKKHIQRQHQRADNTDNGALKALTNSTTLKAIAFK